VTVNEEGERGERDLTGRGKEGKEEE